MHTRLLYDGREMMVLSWADVTNLADQLAKQISARMFRPDVIIGILRGGAIPGTMLSHLLRVPSVATIAVRSHETEEPYSNRMAPRVDERGIDGLVEGKRVLVVDDVANTGRTFAAVKDMLSGKGCIEIRVASLVRDTCDGAMCPADFVGIDIPMWIQFPWETWEPTGVGQPNPHGGAEFL